MPHETALATLELEINKAEQHLASLRYRWNAFMPLCRLPMETIERILLMTQLPKDENPRTRTDTRWKMCYDEDDQITWVRAMLICRYVREAALFSRSVWATINITRHTKKWIDMCLSRAGTRSLHIEGYVGGDTPSPTESLTLDLVLQSRQLRLTLHPHRERNVQLFHESEEQERLPGGLKAAVNNCLSRMMENGGTSLEVVSWGTMNHNITVNRWESLSLSNSLLSSRSINLVHLVLENVKFATMPYLPKLCQLVIRNILHGTKCRMLVDILAQTPNVSFVQIEQSRPSEDELNDAQPLVANTSLVTLPQLDSLLLFGSLTDVTGMIKVFPDPSRNLTIHVDKLDPLPHFRSKLFSAMTKSIHEIQVRAAQYLSNISNKRVLASHCLEPIIAHVGKTALTDLRLAPSPLLHDWPTRSVNMRLGPVRDADLIKLAPYAELVRIGVHSLSAYTVLLSTSTQIRRLIVEDIYVGTTLNVLEQIMAKRARTVGAPLHRLVMQYRTVTVSWGNRDPPPQSIFDDMERKWREAGWVIEVQWDITKGPFSSQSQFHGDSDDEMAD